MAKQTKEINESATRASGRELCEYKSENQSFSESIPTIAGNLSHDICELSFRKLSNNFEEIFEEVFKKYESDFDRYVVKKEDAKTKARKHFKNFQNNFEIKEIFANPDTLRLIDGDEVEGFTFRLFDRNLLKAPLNKTGKNNFIGMPDFVVIKKRQGKLTLIIFDLKTGMTKYSASQLKVYACIMRKMPGFRFEKIIGKFLYLETGQIDTHEFSEDDLDKFQRSRVRAMNRIAKTEKKDLKRSLNKFCCWCEFLPDCKEANDIKIELPYKLVKEIKKEKEFIEILQAIDKIKIIKKLSDSLYEKAKKARNDFIEKNDNELVIENKKYSLKEITIGYSDDIKRQFELAEKYELNIAEIFKLKMSSVETLIASRENYEDILTEFKESRFVDSKRLVVEEKKLNEMILNKESNDEKK